MTLQPMGLVEIADLLGVKRQTANMWNYQGLLPPPGKGTVSGAPWWDKPVIVKWAKETGRLPK